MKDRFPVSVTIIALNEEENLPRALASVRWADDIVVVDSGSKDRTIEIATQFGARVFQNPWPGFGQQKNFAQNLATHDWVLNIDADEEISEPLRDKILEILIIQKNFEESYRFNLESKKRTLGYFIPRKSYYLNRWIRRGGWYPNHLIRLSHRKFSKWSEPEVHEALIVQGQVEVLHEDILHYPFDSVAEQVRTNIRYAAQGAQELANRGRESSVPLLIFKPLAKFLETYLFKLGFLDGLAGLIISINAAHSAFLKFAFLLENRVKREPEQKNARINRRQ
jgi:glycosyltransferase involved in cell wall biosynthesis